MSRLVRYLIGTGLLLLLTMVAACGGATGGGDGADVPGGDLGGESDTASDASPDILGDVVLPETMEDSLDEDSVDADVIVPSEPHPFFDFAGEIRLSQSNEPDGAFTGASVYALLRDAPALREHLLMEEEGACQFWVIGLPPYCDPACDPFTEQCGQDGACHPKPKRISAGVLQFSGTLQAVSAVPDESDSYTAEGLDENTPLFEPGALLSVTAAGDEIPAFEAQVTGVGPMRLPETTHEFVDGQDYVFTWEPEGDGATIEVAFLTGWHGNPSPVVLWCTAPEEAGSFTVPAHMVEMFPSAGCMGLFPNIPWVSRIHRQVVETPFGPISVSARSERTFNLKHGDCF